MPLEEYRRKRDFKNTPEPAPGPIKVRESKLSYLVQKHDATRLHYDFRLELDGVLLSWAVTKGPSLDPHDKRLAVRTEDHPLSYGSFEGTIPQGEYGGGTVMLWDTGTWEPEEDPHAALKKGHLAFVLHGSRLKGRWSLVRMRGDDKRENWLLIKHDDEEARRSANGDFLEGLASSVKSGRSMDEIADGATPAAKKRSPTPTAAVSAKDASRVEDLIRKYPDVQLATLVDEPPQGAGWIHEIKFDGYRLLGFVSGSVVRLRTRNGNDWTGSFPAIVSALGELKAKDAVIDMEAVILDPEGKSNFQALQNALGEGGHRSEIVAYAFDILHLDGKSLISSALTERKAKLEKLLASKQLDALRYSEHIAGQGVEMFQQSCKKGLEGIISKKADSPYVVGRQKNWLKVKCIQRQEFIILGFNGARSGDRAIGALYLGYQENGKLRYAGKVGTGFTMKSARDLVARFSKFAVDTPPFTRRDIGMPAGEWNSIQWLKPVLLCEVAFTEWTQDGRIRHPSFQGLREDKDAVAVKKEESMPAPAPKKAVKSSPALTIGEISITHPDRVISETAHITKGAIAEYYAGVANLLLPRIARRPISLLRCPAGIDGECFYQRNPGRGLGRSFEFRHGGKKYEYLYIEDEKGLLELIQMGVIEIHPWGATIDAIDYPDRLIFDLDPAPDVPFEALKLGAEDLRARLQRRGLKSVLKCTGGKGLHITVPLAGKDNWGVVKSFAASIAEEMVAAAPDAYIATMSKAKRTGKIFIDYFRNDYTATAVADYSVRAHPGAPVACPIEWKELSDLKSADQFTMKDVLGRVGKKKTDSSSRVKPQTIPS